MRDSRGKGAVMRDQAPPLPDPVCFDLCHSVVKLLKVFQVLTVYLFDSKTFQIFTINTLKVHH